MYVKGANTAVLATLMARVALKEDGKSTADQYPPMLIARHDNAFAGASIVLL
jgi:hypothetical protein